MRIFKIAALAVLLAMPAAGCASMLSPSAQQATTVAAAEQAYTTAANLEVVWLNSGKATPDQAKLAKAYREAAYADIVAARAAVANHDNAAVTVSLNLFNQALPALAGYLAQHGASQ